MTHYLFAVDLAFIAMGEDPCNARFARIVQRLAYLLPAPARLLKIAEVPEERLLEIGTRLTATNPAQALYLVILSIEVAMKETPGFDNEMGEMRMAVVKEVDRSASVFDKSEPPLMEVEIDLSSGDETDLTGSSEDEIHR